MELPALFDVVIGLDVHQAQVTACALITEPDGTTRIEQRQFGAFKRDRRALATWAAALHPDEVVMESTGIYWKSPYAALEQVGIVAKVVNARHVKNCTGPKNRYRRCPVAGHIGTCRFATGFFCSPRQTA